jgi:mannosyltransferase OCH1-like enzyme
MRFSEYYGYLRRFGVIFTLREIYYRFFSNILEKRVSSKRDRDTLKYLKRYLNKNSAYALSEQPIKKLNPCIWTCWLQGYDNAPPVVKACINSMRKYANDYDVIVITEENLSDYVSMPDFIIKKYKTGIISTAHFADLLRTLLLINYGGIWMDATVLLTKKIPQILLDSDLFVFQSSLLHNEYQPCSNWFIIAQKNNHVLLRVFEILASFWKDNSKLINYFIFHVTVQLVITYNNEAKQLWQKIFYKNNSDPHLLQKKLFDTFDPVMKGYIWDMSFAHKLTYKFNDVSLPELHGTYYRHIIETV